MTHPKQTHPDTDHNGSPVESGGETTANRNHPAGRLPVRGGQRLLAGLATLRSSAVHRIIVRVRAWEKQPLARRKRQVFLSMVLITGMFMISVAYTVSQKPGVDKPLLGPALAVAGREVIGKPLLRFQKQMAAQDARLYYRVDSVYRTKSLQWADSVSRSDNNLRYRPKYPEVPGRTSKNNQ